MYDRYNLAKEISMHITKGRSAVLSTKGIVTSTQPLASQAGVLTLSRGGNCCDAAIGVAACLSVLEPSSTGPGGDFFALVYKDGKVMGLNGSGKSAGGLTVKVLKGDDVDGLGKKISTGSVHSVTIPGAVAGWIDLIDIYGSNNLTLLEILQPAIDLARNGFPVSKISSS